MGKFDRIRGGLQGVALFTKPSTVQHVESITGKSETFVIETARHENGDYIFVVCVDDTGTTRLCLPPRVSNLIASHRDALTARRRSIASKAVAKARKDRGELPGFARKKK